MRIKVQTIRQADRLCRNESGNRFIKNQIIMYTLIVTETTRKSELHFSEQIRKWNVINWMFSCSYTLLCHWVSSCFTLVVPSLFITNLQSKMMYNLFACNCFFVTFEIYVNNWINHMKYREANQCKDDKKTISTISSWCTKNGDQYS